MTERALRFGVRDEAGHRASAWKLWTIVGTGKHDVYLSAREGRGPKTSLHQSGEWHVAFDRRYLGENLAADHHLHSNPHLKRWHQPAPDDSGVAPAVHIFVPTSGITVPVEKRSPSSMVWIPAGPAGRAVVIDVLFAASDATIPPLPPSLSGAATELVGRLKLENGDSVWVVHSIGDVPLPDSPLTGRVTWFKGHEHTDLSAGSFRCKLEGDAPDGAHFVVDCVLQPSI